MRRTASRADRAGSVATSSELRTTTRPATAVDPELMPPGVIMRTEHHESIRFQGAKGPAEWLRQSFTRCSQQHRNLHVGRLPIRRPLHRSCVFVTVDEEKSRFTYRVSQCRNGRQQNGTIRSVHERELTSGYGCAQLCVQLANHREESTSVEQPRFGITFRARPWHRKVWPSSRCREETTPTRAQPRAAQPVRQPARVRVPCRRTARQSVVRSHSSSPAETSSDVIDPSGMPDSNAWGYNVGSARNHGGCGEND